MEKDTSCSRQHITYMIINKYWKACLSATSMLLPLGAQCFCRLVQSNQTTKGMGCTRTAFEQKGTSQQ